MIRRTGIVLFAVAACCIAVEAPSFDADRYLAHIKFLASPEMKGRASGSPELEKAAKYIADKFHADGLKALGGGYLQPFEIATSSKLGRNNQFESVRAGEIETLQVDKEFVPYNFSSSGKASGQVMFAGYGITAPEYHYDDYAGIDVRGKFVLVLEHEPQEFDDKSVFDGKVYTVHSETYSKAANARIHGARGVILIFDRVNHIGHQGDGHDDLERFSKEGGPPDAGVPVVQGMRESTVLPWIRSQAGQDLIATEQAINTDLKPRSFATSGHRDSRIHRCGAGGEDRAQCGWLPGAGESPGIRIIVGTHYDHLGLGGQFSMAPAMTQARCTPALTITLREPPACSNWPVISPLHGHRRQVQTRHPCS